MGNRGVQERDSTRGESGVQERDGSRDGGREAMSPNSLQNKETCSVRLMDLDGLDG